MHCIKFVWGKNYLLGQLCYRNSLSLSFMYRAIFFEYVSTRKTDIHYTFQKTILSALSSSEQRKDIYKNISPIDTVGCNTKMVKSFHRGFWLWYRRFLCRQTAGGIVSKLQNHKNEECIKLKPPRFPNS